MKCNCISNWIKEEYENWKQEKKEETSKNQIRTIRFVYGDVVPKQGWQTYEEYMQPSGPIEYLREGSVVNATGSKVVGSKYCNWPTTVSLKRFYG